MYVLADLEWVEDKNNRVSFSQIAMVRVDENWQPLHCIYRRIRPIDSSFHLWKHVAFTGGSIDDFLAAPDSAQAFRDIVHWLWPSDTICWWYPDSKTWIQKLVPAITNKQVVLTELVSNFAGADGHGNPYRVGKNLHLEIPPAKHDSRNDIEMMRKVLEHLKFPQPIPKKIPRKKPTDQVGAQSMAYHAHIDTNIIHKKGCPKIPETGHLKGYNELTKPVSKGYVPCDCVKAEFRAARRKRNQSIIDRTEYSFLYSPESKVFHRRDCKIMLNAKTIQGTVMYDKCVSSGRQPCKVCNPGREHQTLVHLQFMKQSAAKKKAAPSSNLSADEQRAINRHRQAQEQRKSVERNSALTQEKREDLCTLSQPGYAFFAAKGYKSFHLRNCRKLSGISNIEGFPWYKDAVRAGYQPCKCCKPTNKHDVVVSLPIYSTKRQGESISQFKHLCNRFGYKYWEEGGLSYMETDVGIWRFSPDGSPYRLEHINLTRTPDNRTDFHRQPRLLLSLKDTFYYIKRHDEGLSLVWKGTEYGPKEAII